MLSELLISPATASQGSQQGCSSTPQHRAPTGAAATAQGCSKSSNFPSAWPLLPVPLLQRQGDKCGCTAQLPLALPGLGKKGRNPSLPGKDPSLSPLEHLSLMGLLQTSASDLPWLGGELHLLFPPLPPSLTLQLYPDLSPLSIAPFSSLLLNPGQGRKIFPIRAWEMLREPASLCLSHLMCRGRLWLGAAGSSRIWESIQSANPRSARLRSQPQLLLHQEGFPCISLGMYLMPWSL